MKKFALLLGVLAVAVMGPAKDRVTVQPQHRSLYDLEQFIGSDRFPVKSGLTLIKNAQGQSVTLSGTTSTIQEALKAIADWDVSPDEFEAHFLWKMPGKPDAKPAIRCLSHQEAAISFGDGKHVTTIKMTAWYQVHIIFALTLDVNGQSLSTLLSGEKSVIHFNKAGTGTRLAITDENGKTVLDQQLPDVWKSLAGSSLEIDLAIVKPTDQKP